MLTNGIGNDKWKSAGMPAQTPVPIPVVEPPHPTCKHTQCRVGSTRHLRNVRGPWPSEQPTHYLPPHAQGRLTQTERDRRIVQGLCLYCGGQGHKASECSKAWKSRETTGRAAQFTAPASVPIGSSTLPVKPDFTVILEN
jgi:hypothetical protein